MNKAEMSLPVFFIFIYSSLIFSHIPPPKKGDGKENDKIPTYAARTLPSVAPF